MIVDDRYAALMERVADLELRVGRLDEPAAVDGAWTVYRIFPEGAPEDTFYIGLTGDLGGRAIQHNNSPQSAANARMKELEARGVHCTMEAIEKFTNRAMARLFETMLIATTPNILNRDVEASRKRLGMIEKAPPAPIATPVEDDDEE